MNEVLIYLRIPFGYQFFISTKMIEMFSQSCMFSKVEQKTIELNNAHKFVRTNESKEFNRILWDFHSMSI